MATVTALTAEKTMALIGLTIHNATLSPEGVLTFHRQNGGSFPVGNVKGPPGAAASGPAIAAEVTAQLASQPQGLVALDSVSANQITAANGGSWYTVTGLSITHTLVSGRAYALVYSATILSERALTALDVEARMGSTWATATPLDRDSKFASVANRGLGFGGTTIVQGSGSKLFQVGFRISDNDVDADLSVRNDTSDGGNNAQLALIDLGVL